MNSKIRIELNFDNYEPFIQLDLQSGDVNDGALKAFVEQANMRGIEIVYHNLDNSNNTPQIRLKNPKQFQEVKENYIKQLDIFAKDHFKPNDYNNWENMYNLFITDGKHWDKQ